MAHKRVTYKLPALVRRFAFRKIALCLIEPQAFGEIRFFGGLKSVLPQQKVR